MEANEKVKLLSRDLRDGQTRLKTWQGSLAQRWREIFRRRRRRHNPMLVLNMSIFNSADGWNRTFNPIKAHENGF